MSKVVVITGSTRGIGRGLAVEFLKRGCRVVISGRTQSAVDAVCKELAAEYGRDQVAGSACEITSVEQLGTLWRCGIDKFSKIDIWINNAGVSIARAPLHQQSSDDIKRIVDINMKGILLANHLVIGEMLKQGSGQIWNMEGFGSNGQTNVGMVPYGATKRAVNYINLGLQKELKNTPVQLCTLSPGIVVTDLLVADYDLQSAEWQRVKKILNILADRVETVTPFLAEGVLKTTRSGAKVAWLTTGKAFRRFMLAAFNKRDLFAEIEAARV